MPGTYFSLVEWTLAGGIGKEASERIPKLKAIAYRKPGNLKGPKSAYFHVFTGISQVELVIDKK